MPSKVSNISNDCDVHDRAHVADMKYQKLLPSIKLTANCGVHAISGILRDPSVGETRLVGL